VISRRRFLTGFVIALAPAATVHGAPEYKAQQARTVSRIGFLQPGEAPGAWLDAFRRGLRELGWIERQNLVIEHRMAPAIADIAAVITELINLKVDVLVTWTTPAVIAAKRATSTIPIVGLSGNPVEMGVVSSLARPSGNVTGVAILTHDLEVKNLELLKQAVPAASRIAVLTNPENTVWAPALKRLNEAAPALAVKIQSLEVRHPDDLENAFATARRERADALLVVREALFGIHRTRIAELALRYRLPSIFGSLRNVEAGGLISYAANNVEMWRRMATYVDKILKGAQPGELPIEQPTKFDLIINMKTAKALGLTIPPSLLLRADHVIE
jgi:putative ABC transport system substrate-binding protein